MSIADHVIERCNGVVQGEFLESVLIAPKGEGRQFWCIRHMANGKSSGIERFETESEARGRWADAICAFSPQTEGAICAD